MTERCAKCSNRGWWLSDARIIVCDCEAFDPPKWVQRGDRACIIPHWDDPDRPRRASGGYACEGHVGRVERLIAELPALYDDLCAALTSSERRNAEQGRAKNAGKNAGLNLNDKVVKEADELHAELVRMVRDVLEQRITPLTVKCPACFAEAGLGCRAPAEHAVREIRAQQVRARLTPLDTVPALATWLGAQVRWLMAQPDADDWHKYLSDMTRDCRSAAFPSGQRRFPVKADDGKPETCNTPVLCDVETKRVIRCPGSLWVRLMPADDREEMSEITCDTCGLEVAAAGWYSWAAQREASTQRAS